MTVFSGIQKKKKWELEEKSEIQDTWGIILGVWELRNIITKHLGGRFSGKITFSTSLHVSIIHQDQHQVLETLYKHISRIIIRNIAVRGEMGVCEMCTRELQRARCYDHICTRIFVLSNTSYEILVLLLCWCPLVARCVLSENSGCLMLFRDKG